jgi:hypothetical protein
MGTWAGSAGAGGDQPGWGQHMRGGSRGAEAGALARGVFGKLGPAPSSQQIKTSNRGENKIR